MPANTCAPALATMADSKQRAAKMTPNVTLAMIVTPVASQMTIADSSPSVRRAGRCSSVETMAYPAVAEAMIDVGGRSPRGRRVTFIPSHTRRHIPPTDEYFFGDPAVQDRSNRTQ